MSERTYWGLFREREHSPGRESDDAEILRLTGKHLESRGVHVELRAPEDLSVANAARRDLPHVRAHGGAPRAPRLAGARGAPGQRAARRCQHLPRAHYRAAPRAPTCRSSRAALQGLGGNGLIGGKCPAATTPRRATWSSPHTGDEAAAAPRGLAARGFERAAWQPPVEGDLIKFYGGGAGAAGPTAGRPVPLVLPQGAGRSRSRAWPAWSRGRDRARARGLRRRRDRLRRRPARAVLDVNAWPSFALYRDEAAPAAYLGLRFAESRWPRRRAVTAPREVGPALARDRLRPWRRPLLLLLLSSSSCSAPWPASAGSDFKHHQGPFLPGQYSTPYADCYRCPFKFRYPTAGSSVAEYVATPSEDHDRRRDRRDHHGADAGHGGQCHPARRLSPRDPAGGPRERRPLHRRRDDHRLRPHRHACGASTTPASCPTS